MPYQTALTISSVIKDIDSKEYLLPFIQREFVWSTGQIEKLFDSLMRDYPINAFFHFKFLPKVWRTSIKSGVNFSVLLSLWNMRKITLWTASKRRPRSSRSSRKKYLSSESMVKTQWRCWTLIILKDMEVVRSIEYLVPQVGQNLLWQRKGTNLRVSGFH